MLEKTIMELRKYFWCRRNFWSSKNNLAFEICWIFDKPWKSENHYNLDYSILKICNQYLKETLPKQWPALVWHCPEGYFWAANAASIYKEILAKYSQNLTGEEGGDKGEGEWGDHEGYASEGRVSGPVYGRPSAETELRHVLHSPVEAKYAGAPLSFHKKLQSYISTCFTVGWKQGFRSGTGRLCQPLSISRWDACITIIGIHDLWSSRECFMSCHSRLNSIP